MSPATFCSPFPQPHAKRNLPRPLLRKMRLAKSLSCVTVVNPRKSLRMWLERGSPVISWKWSQNWPTFLTRLSSQKMCARFKVCGLKTLAAKSDTTSNSGIRQIPRGSHLRRSSPGPGAGLRPAAPRPGARPGCPPGGHCPGWRPWSHWQRNHASTRCPLPSRHTAAGPCREGCSAPGRLQEGLALHTKVTLCLRRRPLPPARPVAPVSSPKPLFPFPQLALYSERPFCAPFTRLPPPGPHTLVRPLYTRPTTESLTGRDVRT